jgi:hypothetical protein
MKEYSNTNVTDKVHCSPLGAGGILTYYQQLPIKVKFLRLLVQPLIEKGIAHDLYGPVHIIQHRLANCGICV